MNEKRQMMGPIVRKFVVDQIDMALSRNHLPYDSSVREDLESRAEVAGARQTVVRVLDESGCSLTLDDRIKQLKYDPRLVNCFPPDPPRISRTDQKKLNANFVRILTGEIVVE
jgi:hypothetical protein